MVVFEKQHGHCKISNKKIKEWFVSLTVLIPESQVRAKGCFKNMDPEDVQVLSVSPYFVICYRPHNYVSILLVLIDANVAIFSGFLQISTNTKKKWQRVWLDNNNK